ncbi:MAG: DUF2878 domain-containing protein [Desulfopila sp.]|jgi:hypothetical protein|nr:DUF2878 domain-containing protein [Desulfopila sp.]
MNIFVNLAGYQAIWFLCVLFGNSGAVAGLFLVVLHLLLTDKRIADAKVIMGFVAAGVIIDTAMQYFSVLAFDPPSRLIPFWLVIIWAGLATLPLHSLRWMQGRHLINIVFGGVGGPLAYWGGVQLGGAEFPQSVAYSLAVLALVWAVFWPAAMLFVSRVYGPGHHCGREKQKDRIHDDVHSLKGD